MRLAGLSAGLLALAACDAAFTNRVDVAARAAGAELPVTKLAEIIAQNDELRLQRDVVEGVALLWIDYTLLADRLIASDSLLDSATVVEATWPDVQQAIASAYHDLLFADSMRLDSAQVDSVYDAGEYRLIRHVLFQIDDETPAEIRGAKRRQAEYVLNQLRRGEVSWEEAAQVTDEPGGDDRNGTLGVIARGDMVEPFENAAYALAPGGFSGVVETSFGFHIIYRPDLVTAREEFADWMAQRMERDFDSLYLEQLEQEWDISVRDGAVPAVREMAMDPLRAKRSGRVIGDFRGGEFRVRELARWLQGMDPRVRQGIAGGSDEQIAGMVRALIRNEVLLREAREAGVSLSREELAALTEQLRRRLALVRSAVGLSADTVALLRQLPPAQAREQVQILVTRYLEGVSRNDRVLRTVPPFLGDELRAHGDWDLVPAGLERALGNARTLRTQIDSVRGNRPGPRRTVPRDEVPSPEIPGTPRGGN